MSDPLIDAINSPHAQLIADAIGLRAQRVSAATTLENLEQQLPQIEHDMRFGSDSMANNRFRLNLHEQAITRKRFEQLLINESDALGRLRLAGVPV